MNLREALEETLRARPFLEEALNEDLINLSSMARLLLPDIQRLTNKDIKESAVVMAIRRREPALQLKLQHKLQQFIRTLGDITVRSNLMVCTYSKTSSLSGALNNFLVAINNRPEGFYSISTGLEEITLVISQEFTEDLNKAFENEKELERSSNLSSISLRLPTKNSEVIGLYYFFFKHIAQAGINIREIISTTNEATFIVNNEDVDKAFITINSIKRI